MANYTIVKGKSDINVMLTQRKKRSNTCVLNLVKARSWAERVILLEGVISVKRKNGKYDIYLPIMDEGYRLIVRGVDVFKYSSALNVLVVGRKKLGVMTLKVIMLDMLLKKWESRSSLRKKIDDSETIVSYEKVEKLSVISISNKPYAIYKIFAIKVNDSFYMFSRNNYGFSAGKKYISRNEFHGVKDICPLGEDFYKIECEEGYSIVNSHMEIEFGPYKSIEALYIKRVSCGFCATDFSDQKFWLNYTGIWGARYKGKTEIPMSYFRTLYNRGFNENVVFALYNDQKKCIGIKMVNFRYDSKDLGRDVYAVSFEKKPTKRCVLYNRVINYSNSGEEILSFKDIWKLDNRFIICEVSRDVTFLELEF